MVHLFLLNNLFWFSFEIYFLTNIDKKRRKTDVIHRLSDWGKRCPWLAPTCSVKFHLSTSVRKFSPNITKQVDSCSFFRKNESQASSANIWNKWLFSFILFYI